jgi:hypothetical protein
MKCINCGRSDYATDSDRMNRQECSYCGEANWSDERHL